MTRHAADRLDDITIAIAAIRAHVGRGPMTDALVFDAVRVRLIEIGEAVKALPAELLDQEPSIPWAQVAAMRNRLAHRYFDTSVTVLQVTVDRDLADIEAAVNRLADLLD